MANKLSKKRLYIIIALVVFILVLVWWFKRKQSPTTETYQAGSTPSLPTSPSTGSSSGSSYTPTPSTGGGLDLGKVLKMGVNAPEVGELQRLMNIHYGRNLSEDNAFGSKTESALRAITDKRSITLFEFQPYVATAGWF